MDAQPSSPSEPGRLPLAALPARALRESLRAGYSSKRFRADAMSGLVVGTIALPLSMALAIAIGAPPQNGLYTAIVAGIVIALLGGSATQVSGPTAAFIVVLAPIVHEFGLGGLCVATALAGVVLLLMGLARLGRLVTLVPYPVTTGFTLGIGLTIGIGQLPDFFGVSSVGLDPHAFERVAGLVRRSAEMRLPDFGIGLATLALLWLWPRVTRRVPAPLVALAAVALVAFVLQQVWPGFEYATLRERFHYVDAAGAEVGGIPPWPPSFAWPWQLGGGDGKPLVFGLPLLKTLLLPACTIALLGAIESLLSATVADGMTGTRHDPDAELIGQGCGNLVVPFFGGFAATGAIARTATNIRSGGTSPIASVVHAVFLLGAMLALAPALGWLPMAALAALLMRMAWSMSDLPHVTRAVRTSPGHDIWVLATCTFLTVAFDMVVAVITGIVLASLLFMRRMAEISGVATVGAEHLDLDEPVPEGVVLYEVAGALFFGAAERAMSTLGRAQQKARVVVVALHSVPVIDQTGLVNLQSALTRLRHAGSVVILAGAREQPRQAFDKAGLVADPGHLEFAPSVRRAIRRATELLPG